MNRKAALVFFTFWTVFAAVISVGGVIDWWEGLHGGTTTATVVHVYSQQDYTVSFTTKYGTRCETAPKWTPRREPVKVGDTFEVRYSSNSPCDNVDRADDGFARYGLLVMPLAFLVVGLVAIAAIKSWPWTATFHESGIWGYGRTDGPSGHPR